MGDQACCEDEQSNRLTSCAVRYKTRPAIMSGSLNPTTATLDGTISPLWLVTLWSVVEDACGKTGTVCKSPVSSSPKPAYPQVC